MTQTPQIHPPIEDPDPNHLDPDTLNAYIDGELPSARQQGIEQHIAACHPCTLRILSATQLKAATARAGQRFTPPPEALARLTAKLHSQSQQPADTQPQRESQSKPNARLYSMRPLRPTIMRPAYLTVLAAAILLAISLLGWRQFHQTNTLAAELLDQHLATLSSAAAPQVISSDRHTVKPWFQGRLPFSFNLPDASALPADTTLKGANLTYLNGQPAALLLFTIHKHEVSVLLTQRSTTPTLSALPSNRAGFTLRAVLTPELRIIAVSDVNPADLNNLLTSLVAAQNPT